MTERSIASEDRQGRPRTGRRALRIVLIVFILIGVLFGGAALYVSRSGVVDRIVREKVELSLGCECVFSGVSLSLDGRLVIRDLSLRVAGLPGDAGEFMRADEAAIDLDLSGAIDGKPDAVRSIDLQGATVRLSQSEDLRLNIAGIAPAPSVGGGGAVRIPRITMTKGTLELGEHDATSYTRLTSIAVSGEAETDADAPTRLAFSLIESAGDAVNSMALEGSFDLVTLDGDAVLRRVDLTRWGEVPAPARFREVWAALSLRGRVETASLSYSQTNGLVVGIDLHGVDMDLPIIGRLGDALEGAEAERIELRSVEGDLSFRTEGFTVDLEGTIAELPVEVDFSAGGYREDAPFNLHIVSKPFDFDESPALLPFVPENVRDLLERLSSPAAEVDGSVTIARDAGGELSVNGGYTLRDGVVAYEAFPYPISGVTATLIFDLEQVTIVSIVGQGPTGAQLLANGTIAPLGQDAVLTLDADLFELPVDATFRAALPAGVGAVIDAVMHEESYRELVREGLVMPSDIRAGLEIEREAIGVERARALRAGDDERASILDERLDEIDRLVRTPVYDLGGTAELSATIRQRFGDEPRFDGEIGGRVRGVSILPRVFPYPATIEEATIAVRDWDAFLEDGVISGITGGRGSVSARIPGIDEVDREEISSLTVHLDEAPADEYFLRALPGGASPPAGRASAEAIARRLGVSGVMRDVFVEIGERGDSGQHGFDISAALDGGASLAPAGSPITVRLSEGSVAITESELVLSLERGETEAGGVRGMIETTFGYDEPTDVLGRIVFPALDLTREAELFFAGVSPDAVAAARDARALYTPSGVADVSVLLGEGPGGASGVSFSNGRGIGIDFFDGRLGIERMGGTVFTTGARTSFAGVDSMPVTFDGEPAGTVSATGVWSEADAARPGDTIELRADGARVESGLVRRTVRGRSERLADWLDEHAARGTFDIGVVRSEATGGRLRGWIDPRAFTIDRRGETIPVEFGGGRVTFSEDGGEIDAVDARVDEWLMQIGGAWRTEAEGSVDLSFTARGGALSDRVLAALPGTVAGTLGAVDLDVGTAFAIQQGSLVIERAFAETPAATFRGSLAFNDASIRTGVLIDEISGTAEIFVRDEGRGTLPDADITIDATHLEVVSVEMDSGRVRIESDRSAGTLEIPEIRLFGHGGLMTGYGTVGFDSDGTRTARVRLDASGMAFSSFYGDLLDTLTGDEDGDDAAPTEAQTGVLDGSLSVETVLGKAGSTVGRGLVRVRSGEIVEMPGVLPLLELSNLQIPAGERLEIGYADFFVMGDRLEFGVLEAESETLLIAGTGSVRLSDGALDLRFRTESGTGIELLSQVFAGIRDEFFSSRVTGTVREPVWSVEQLPATRRFLATIFGGARKTERPTEGEGVRPEQTTDGEDGDR